MSLDCVSWLTSSVVWYQHIKYTLPFRIRAQTTMQYQWFYRWSRHSFPTRSTKTMDDDFIWRNDYFYTSRCHARYQCWESRGAASITRTLLFQYGSLLKEVLPKLSLDEQRQVHDAFAQYHSMLMTSQKFLTRTTMLVKQAKTQRDLLRTIDAKILEHLINEAEILLTQFRKVHDSFHGKVKDEKVNKMLADFNETYTYSITCVAVGTLTYGLAVGFTPIAFQKPPTSLLAHWFRQRQRLKLQTQLTNRRYSEQLIENLKEIKSQLSKLSQDYARIDGMQDVLTMEDREDFLNVLADAQNEVNRGFEILSRF